MLAVGVRMVRGGTRVKYSNIKKSRLKPTTPKNQMPLYLSKHQHHSLQCGGRKTYQSKVEGRARWIHHGKLQAVSQQLDLGCHYGEW